MRVFQFGDLGAGRGSGTPTFNFTPTAATAADAGGIIQSLAPIMRSDFDTSAQSRYLPQPVVGSYVALAPAAVLLNKPAPTAVRRPLVNKFDTPPGVTEPPPADPCADITCSDGEHCDMNASRATGVCVPNVDMPPVTDLSCANVTCSPGEICQGGHCIPVGTTQQQQEQASQFPWGWVIGGVAAVAIARFALRRR